MSVTDGAVGRQADDGRDSPASTEQLTLVSKSNLFYPNLNNLILNHKKK